jgi:hypothetical protein
LVVVIALDSLVLVRETWVFGMLLYGVVVVLMLCMELIELDLIVFAHGKGVKHKCLDYHLI